MAWLGLTHDPSLPDCYVYWECHNKDNEDRCDACDDGRMEWAALDPPRPFALSRSHFMSGGDIATAFSFGISSSERHIGAYLDNPGGSDYYDDLNGDILYMDTSNEGEENYVLCQKDCDVRGKSIVKH